MYCNIVRKLDIIQDVQPVKDINDIIIGTGYPVTIDQLRTQIRQSSSMEGQEDSLLEMFIAAATVAVENNCGLSLCARKLRMSLNAWPTLPVTLWYPNVASVDALKYYDGNNVQQSIDPSFFDADLTGILPTVSLSYGKTWPVERERPFPISIEYTTLPFSATPLNLAVLMMAADYYENRESQITSQYFGERSVIQNPAMQRLLFPYQVVS